MKYFSYKQNKNNHEEFFVEDIAVSEIAKSAGTPFYCYSKQAIIENYQNFAKNFADVDHKICYAIKANHNINIVKIFAALGSGIDVVSAGEIFRALKAGIDPKKIVFAGVGKTKEDVEFALKNGIEEFSAESQAEIFLLNEVATRLGKKIKLSIRVNPDVDAKTHDKISTGRKGDKFGVDIDIAEDLYEKVRNLPAIEIYGIATHIGSQITSIEPFKAAFLKIRELFLRLQKKGFALKSLDFGGGIGILYKDENILLIEEYAKVVKEIIKDLNVKLTIAPGRALIGNTGVLVTKVIYLKETQTKNFVIVDSAMNDLMRPGLYGSYHELLPAKIKRGNKRDFDIAGPVCETTDILAKNRSLINPQSDDLLILCSAGAYGSSMSNEYNCRPLIPEILVDGNKFTIIRKRPSFDEMIYLESF